MNFIRKTRKQRKTRKMTVFTESDLPWPRSPLGGSGRVPREIPPKPLNPQFGPPRFLGGWPKGPPKWHPPRFTGTPPEPPLGPPRQALVW